MLVHTRLRSGLATLALFALPAGAQMPSLAALPPEPGPGAVVRLLLNTTPESQSAAVVQGWMAGEPVHFREVEPGVWRGIGAIPVDASDSVVAHAVLRRASGSTDTIRTSVVLPQPRTARGPARALAVAPRFTRPLDAATQARIDRENAMARGVGRRSHDTPPLWTEEFLRPRASQITSRFGTGRLFNGSVSSRHLGVDFRGAVGDPVRAANRGVVALVDEFFLAGNVVYIDHGGGIVTGYFHLSRALVAAGDTVERGQSIGLVGSTGRVTGPHLHWNARYGSLTVNPLDLVALGEW